ncbi:hypothetical protein ACHAW5_009663 [Stephanodiscus triporus]|uniref:Uncharacterized protein n=1 Tax=Stephanodiscus triporus TaxID=2934178 RepID=A0ABD3N6E8_9STRA
MKNQCLNRNEKQTRPMTKPAITPPRCAAQSTNGMKLMAMTSTIPMKTSQDCRFLDNAAALSFRVVDFSQQRSAISLNFAPNSPITAPLLPTEMLSGMKQQLKTLDPNAEPTYTIIQTRLPHSFSHMFPASIWTRTFPARCISPAWRNTGVNRRLYQLFNPVFFLFLAQTRGKAKTTPRRRASTSDNMTTPARWLSSLTALRGTVKSGGGDRIIPPPPPLSRHHRRGSSSSGRVVVDRRHNDDDDDDDDDDENDSGVCDPPTTNGGSIVGVWCFHRHGDRAPNRHLGNPACLVGESEHWRGRMPDRDVRDGLSKFFPPDVHPSQNGGVHLDVAREPFGFLTYRGMDQMREAGWGFRRRCERFGRRVAAGGSGGGGGDRGGGGGGDDLYSFLDHWNVEAYSTNYLRTVMSVQCFIDGLIGDRPGNEQNRRQKIYAGGGLRRYYRDIGAYERVAHTDRPIWTTEEDMVGNGNDGKDERQRHRRIRIQVRDKEIDTLNSFDKYPRTMDRLVKDVIATERFQRIDGSAKPLADKLCALLPGLRDAPQSFGGTPSGINWIHANDYFVCRGAHSIPLAADFSDDGRYKSPWDERGREEVERALRALAAPVSSHLAWRFREWYRCPRLLSAVAAPPFREVYEGMVDAAAKLRPDDRAPFVLYSCHDVTLLALLYALGTDFLASGEDCGGENMREDGEEGGNRAHYSGMAAGKVRRGKRRSSWRWWPPYSSTIAFELVRLEDNRSTGSDHQFAIRVILNGETLRLIPRMSVEDEVLLKEQSLSSREVFGEMTANGKCKMLRLSDFDRIISVLEEVGDRGRSLSNSGHGPIGSIGVDGG